MISLKRNLNDVDNHDGRARSPAHLSCQRLQVRTHRVQLVDGTTWMILLSNLIFSMVTWRLVLSRDLFMGLQLGYSLKFCYCGQGIQTLRLFRETPLDVA